MSGDEQVIKKPILKKPTGNPNTMDMVIEAITALDDRKGVSVPAIKSFIVDKYPTVDPNKLKHRLKKAVEKAMEGDFIARPKNSDKTGASLNGRFHLNKSKKVAVEKAKQTKDKTKANADKPKVKKPKTLQGKEKAVKKTSAKPKKAASKQLDVSRKLVKEAKKTIVKKADLKKKMKTVAKTNIKTPVKLQKKMKEKGTPRASKRTSAK